MGLDTVELVMSVEEEFDIEIPDAIAENMISVGDVVDYVLIELVRLGRRADPLDVFLRVRRRTVDITNADPENITRSTTFIGDLRMD